MKQALLILLSLSLSGSLLCLLLLLARPLLGGRLPKAFFYYAWLPVLLRLLLPFGYGFSLPLVPQAGFEEAPALQLEEQAAPATGQEAASPPPAAAAPEGAAQTHTPAEPAYKQQPQAAFSPWAVLFGVWLVGAAGSLCWYAIAYLTFTRKTRRSLLPPPAEELTLFEVLRAGRPVRLAHSEAVTTPMLVGLARPVIVLPQSSVLPGGEKSLSAALRHELTHYRRRDIAYKWLVVLATSLHWFNPLVYWMRRQISLDCELSCDEAVLRALEPEARMAYGDLLLALAAGCRLPSGATATTLYEEKRQLKARLQGILHYRRPTRAVICTAGALALLLCCCACALFRLDEQQTVQTPAPTTAEADPYADILEQYTQALTQREPDAYPELPVAITNPYWAWQDEDGLLDRIGCARLDLNEDGVEELVLGWAGGEFWNLDEGYVFAIYTLVDGQPVLAAEGWERNLYVIGEDGLLANCGSSSAWQTVWTKYRFDPEAEGFLEAVEQTSASEVGEVWMASGISIPFTLLTGERPLNAAYRAVLMGEAPLLYCGDEQTSKYITEIPALFSPYSSYAIIESFAVVDLDRDGAREVVLSVTDVAGDSGGYLILRQEGDTIYGFPSDPRTFWALKTDGSFDYSAAAGFDDGTARIHFTPGGYTMDKFLRAQGEQFVFDTFFINGQPVSQEDYEDALAQQASKPNAVWYTFQTEQIQALS